MTRTPPDPGVGAAAGASSPGALQRVLHARPAALAEVLDGLGGLGRVLDDEDDLRELLEQLCAVARRVVPGCDAAGVTVAGGRQPVTAASTDAWTLAIDRDQYDADEGPCLEALRTGSRQRVDVSEAQQRWPAFAAAATDEGVRSFLAAPLAAGDRVVGALNLYARGAAAFDDVDEDVVEVLAERAGALVASHLRTADARLVATQLETALASRATIEQAKGVLMDRHGVDAATAFDLLREESQRLNIKLRVVARALLEQTHTPLAAADDDAG